MSDRFIPLDCNDDVLLLDRDTFKVSRLKELCFQEIGKKLNHYVCDSNTKQNNFSLSDFFRRIQLNQENINFQEIQFNSLNNCQVLRLSGKGWQKGQLKISICISFNSNIQNKVILEFCPDEPIASESPLSLFCYLRRSEF
jgi:hypothetical protein